MKDNKLCAIVHPYTPATVNDLERWLQKQASIGWRLEEIRGWKFVFRKCKPYECKFFCYSGLGKSIGISYDYYASKNRYAAAKAPINKENSIVYEVDVSKIDIDFKYYISLRNKYYLKHYLGFLLFALAYTLVPLWLVLVGRNLPILFFVFVGLLMFAYSLFSVVVLLREIKRNKRMTDGSVS